MFGAMLAGCGAAATEGLITCGGTVPVGCRGAAVVEGLACAATVLVGCEAAAVEGLMVCAGVVGTLTCCWIGGPHGVVAPFDTAEGADTMTDAPLRWSGAAARLGWGKANDPATTCIEPEFAA
mmetsp:Transcript_44199/g.102070  ORF Transcript_44199/g.102070 Transcript_44199/m.102070 type:complete len:123 (-) Transcript_44199:1247-1615(-)